MPAAPAGTIGGADIAVAGQRPAEAEVAGIGNHIGRRTGRRAAVILLGGRLLAGLFGVEVLELGLDGSFLGQHSFQVVLILRLEGFQILLGGFALGIGNLQVGLGDTLFLPLEDDSFFVRLDFFQGSFNFHLILFDRLLLDLLLLFLGAEGVHQLLVRFGNRLHQLDVGDKIGKAVGGQEHRQRRSLTRLVEGNHPGFKNLIGVVNLNLFRRDVLFQLVDIPFQLVDLVVLILNLPLQGADLLIHQGDLVPVELNLRRQLGLVFLLGVDLALQVVDLGVDVVQLGLDGVFVRLDLTERAGGDLFRRRDITAGEGRRKAEGCRDGNGYVPFMPSSGRIRVHMVFLL